MLLTHLLTTVAKRLGPGGTRAVVTESLGKVGRLGSSSSGTSKTAYGASIRIAIRHRQVAAANKSVAFVAPSPIPAERVVR